MLGRIGAGIGRISRQALRVKGRAINELMLIPLVLRHQTCPVITAGQIAVVSAVAVVVTEFTTARERVVSAVALVVRPTGSLSMRSAVTVEVVGDAAVTRRMVARCFVIAQLALIVLAAGQLVMAANAGIFAAMPAQHMAGGVAERAVAVIS